MQPTEKSNVSRKIKPHVYSCPTCAATFPYHRKMRRHQKSQHEGVTHKCTECQKTFSRHDNLERHRKAHNKKRIVSIMPKYGQQKGEGSSKRYEYLNPPTKSACLNTFFTYTSTPKETVAYDLNMFLTASKEEIENILKEATLEHRGVKWYINVNVSFIRNVSAKEEERCTGNFRSTTMINLIGDSPLTNIEQAIKKVLQSYEEFQGKGSGWILERIHYLETKISVYVPTKKL